MIGTSALRWQGLLSVLLSFPTVLLAQGAGCANLTISSAADADAIRKTCKTITGDLTFDYFFNETINLDGIEVIEGNLKHDGDVGACDTYEAMDKFPCLVRFTISSSTLRQINGDIHFWYFIGLEELSFPNLARVKHVGLMRLAELKTLDLTNLQYVEYFWLEAINLSKFSLDELKAFTGPGNGGVWVRAGGVENLDGLFRNNLDPWQNVTETDYMQSTSGVTLDGPSLKSLTFGWKRIPRLSIFTHSELSIVFGGPNSTEMEITALRLEYGVVKVERGKTVRSFKVGKLEVYQMHKMEQLEVPFDQLGSLSIGTAPELTSVVLPPQAEDWTNFSLTISDCPNWNLSSEYTMVDGERKKTWYWPRSDWSVLHISANMANEFFESFLAPPVPRVKDVFRLEDRPGNLSGNLDCTLFEKVATPPSSLCYSPRFPEENSGARSMGSLAGGQVVLMGVVIVTTMIV